MATPTASADPQGWWILDSLAHGGHGHADVLAFAVELADQDDQAQVQRGRGLRTTAGLDLGPRRPRRLLGWLLGSR